VAQVSRRPVCAEAGRFGDLAELTADVRRVQRRPDDRGEDEVVILPQSTGRQPILGLPLAVLPQGLNLLFNPSACGFSFLARLA